MQNKPSPKHLMSLSQHAYVTNLIQRGLALHQEFRLEEAQLIYEQALRVHPHNFDALHFLGILLTQISHYEQAHQVLSKAIKLNSKNPACYNNLGITLKELKRISEALYNFNKAIALDPSFPEPYNNKGRVLHDLKKYDDAVLNYDKAIKLKPENAEPYCNKGISLKELNRLDEAIFNFNRAISIKPDYLEAIYNKGISLQELKHFGEAFASYEKAFSIKSDYDFLIGLLLHAKMLICHWEDFDQLQNTLLQNIHSGKKASTPFSLLALTDSPSTHKLCSEIYSREMHPANNLLGGIPKRLKKNKIRLGYYSADFWNHPVSILIAELFETHNKDKFELIGFSVGPNIQDEMRERLMSSFDQFFDVGSQSDQEIAKLSRLLDIDIAIDLGGFTKNARTNIFAYRAAPIQLSYIGYLGTMGAEYFDYLIADSTIISRDSEPLYSEKIIYLPSYQVNDRKRRISNKAFTRKELGLPDSGFVFACFNNTYKILPATFDGWMSILKAVEGSVLFLYADNQLTEQNLKKEAEKRDIEPERIIFGQRLPFDEYLARYHMCDLFLDTLPYNAGTTASDALWVGLPVLTLLGKSFPARYAASLLKAIELPELITYTQEEYESLAIELGTNPEKLATIKQRLTINRLTTPLFNTPLFTKHIEDAYTKVMERYWSNLPPDTIYCHS